MSNKKGKKKVKKDADFQWKVIVPQKVKDTIKHIAQCAEPDEIQMLGEVSYEGGVFYLHDVSIIKQVVTGASTSFVSKDLAQFTETHPHPERLRGWVHSHVRMGCFWSGTDEGTIERFVRRGWCLSIVISLKDLDEMEMRARVDLNMEPVLKELEDLELPKSFAVLQMLPNRATWDNVTIEVEGMLSEEERDFLTEEVKEKLSDERPSTSGKVVYKMSQDVSGNSDKSCENCIYDGTQNFCEKGIDRGPERTVMGCRSFYPAYKGGIA